MNERIASRRSLAWIYLFVIILTGCGSGGSQDSNDNSVVEPIPTPSNPGSNPTPPTPPIAQPPNDNMVVEPVPTPSDPSSNPPPQTPPITQPPNDNVVVEPVPTPFDPGSNPLPQTPPIAQPPPEQMPSPPPGIVVQGSTFQNRNATARFLTQATFGPTTSDIDALTGTSASQWYLAELNKSPTLMLNEFERYLDFFRPEGDRRIVESEASTFAFWLHAITADDQLRQRVAFALSQLLVVSNAQDTVLADFAEAIGAFQDILRRNAFGNYRELLEEVTYSPAMGFYLTYLGNRKADPATGRMPDENYAREILQLFSIGIVELNPDGSQRLDAAGLPIESYSNADITGLAKVFTGLDADAGAGGVIGDIPRESWTRPMRMYEFNHATTAKTFLGSTIPESTDGQSSISQALDIIFRHPNVAPFVGRQLIQRLTSSNPSPAYVARVAQAFNTGQFVLPDGSSVGVEQRGDLAATIAAVLFDPEVRLQASLSYPSGGKVREPILRFTAWARAFEVKTVTPELTQSLWDTSETSALSQHPFRSQSVFNFYRPGYVAPGTESGALGLTAPELQIVNASSIPGYANFMDFFISAGTTRTDVDELGERFANDGFLLDASLARSSFVPDYGAELALIDRPSELVEQLAHKLTYGTLTANQRQEIVTVLELLPAGDSDSQERIVHTAVLLVMMSPDFLIQR